MNMVTNIALVAHDSRKQELLDWVRYNAGSLKHSHLFCTGTTGRLVSETLTEKLGPEAPSVVCMLSGPLGGDFEIGGMIAEGKIDMLVFFCDNLIMQGHQNDVMGLTRLASLYNIPFATNRSTADFIISSPLYTSKEYRRIIPSCIDSYKTANCSSIQPARRGIGCRSQSLPIAEPVEASELATIDVLRQWKKG